MIMLYISDQLELSWQINIIDKL